MRESLDIDWAKIREGYPNSWSGTHMTHMQEALNVWKVQV